MSRARAMVFLGLAALVSLSAFGYFIPMEEWTAKVISWTENHGKLGPPIFVIVYILAGLFCLPVLPLTIAGGALFGVFAGSMLVSVSTTSTALIAFMLGRRGFRRGVTKLAKEYPNFRKIDRSVGREGWKIVAMLRFVVIIPFGVSNYCYGLTPIRWQSYAIATHFAMLPGTILYCYLGSAGNNFLRGNAMPDALDYAVIAIAIVAKLLIIFMVTRIVTRSLESNSPVPT